MHRHLRRITTRFVVVGSLAVAGGLLPAVPAFAAGPTSQPITIPYRHQPDVAGVGSAAGSTPRLPVCRPPDCYYA
jgi:hypothetical protein